MISTLSTEVIVKNIETMQVAYVRHVGPYKGDYALFGRLWGRLMQWAGPRGHLSRPDVKMLCVYHDSPDIPDESKLRTSVCVTVPAGTAVDGDIGTMQIEGGAYAVGHFEIASNQFEDAWGYMYGVWMPESGYQPDDKAPFELCLNNPEEHPQRKHIIEICVPVKPF